MFKIIYIAENSYNLQIGSAETIVSAYMLIGSDSMSDTAREKLWIWLNTSLLGQILQIDHKTVLVRTG